MKKQFEDPLIGRCQNVMGFRVFFADQFSYFFIPLSISIQFTQRNVMMAHVKYRGVSKVT